MSERFDRGSIDPDERGRGLALEMPIGISVSSNDEFPNRLPSIQEPAHPTRSGSSTLKIEYGQLMLLSSGVLLG
jgi:hypothetical protein